MPDCVLGSQYIPSIEYFAHWIQHGEILIEAHENFQKRTWRNRTCILSPGDPLLLTVPLQKGKHQQMNIRDVLISYAEPWPELHVRSLQTAYGKTAFAEEVLEGIFMNINSGKESLWELNIALLDYLTSLLPGDWTYSFTKHFEKNYPKEIYDFRSGIPAGITGISDQKIPQYPQVQRLHQSFQPNLSILDVLCHLGPGTMDYLSRYAAQLYTLT